MKNVTVVKLCCEDEAGQWLGNIALRIAVIQLQKKGVYTCKIDGKKYRFELDV